MEYYVPLNCIQVHMHKSKWRVQTYSIFKTLHSRIQCFNSTSEKHSILHQQE